MITFFYIISPLILFFLVVIISGVYFSEPAYTGSKSDHFDGTYFHNPDGRKAKELSDVIKWSSKRQRGKWVHNYETFIRTEPILPAPLNELYATFVNHSTFLLQTSGINILTDPVWSKRVSPIGWAGPKRMRPPGINFEQLPKIDLVLLTHNHYDHLDIATLKKLERKFQPTYVVPLGVKSMLDKYGFQNIIELDWWQVTKCSGVEIIPTPANHFSGRGTLDRNKTLWCGYQIRTNTKNILYVGDTGYGDVFKKIGERIGPVDVAFIPIGAYLPRWFMSPIHISPDEALKVHQDINSSKSIAMHFGTFPLADEGQGIPESDLERFMNESKIPYDQFIIPEEGKTLIIS